MPDWFDWSGEEKRGEKQKRLNGRRAAENDR